jgi:phosphoglycerate dehydrogenase-like enzyme
MRIHVQNPEAVHMEVSPELWHEACARAGAIAEGHEISFGTDEAAFAAAMQTADILITATSALAKRIPFTAPRLKMVFCTSAGVDRLMPADWLPPGAKLLNNSGVHSAKSGEYAAMALLMLNARIPEAIAAQQTGTWKPFLTPTLRGKHVTVVGTGTLGAAAARAARQFGAHVTGVRRGHDPHPDFDAVVSTDRLDDILPTSQFLVLACPLTAATRNLMTRQRLERLPKGAGIVNVGRGGLVEQEALCDLLDSGHLRGAILDVFVPEPLPQGHRVWTTKNLVATAHMAADDPTTYYSDSLDIFFTNLTALVDGHPLPNLVDLTHGY